MTLGLQHIFIPVSPIIFILKGADNVLKSGSGAGETSSSKHSQIGGIPSKESEAKSGSAIISSTLSQRIGVIENPLKDLDIEFLKKNVSGLNWDSLLKKLSNKSVANWDIASIKLFNSECRLLLQKPNPDRALFVEHIRNVFRNYIVPVMKDKPLDYFDDALEFPQLLDIIDEGVDDVKSIRADLRRLGYINGLPVGKCDKWIRIRCKKCNCSKQ
jgi:hypothetical protein